MEERIFERKIYSEMLDWKAQNDGCSALLIEGARRVGKSTIVEQFARNEYRSYILIDFNKAGKDVHQLFEESVEDLDYLFLYLLYVCRTIGGNAINVCCYVRKIHIPCRYRPVR